MSGLEIVVALLLGVLVNEFTGVSPWLGRRLAAWSARLRYGDTPRGLVRAEELEAVIEARPGSFLKLVTGANLAVASLVVRARRLVTGEPERADAPSADEVLASARRVLPMEDEPTLLVARYLFPTERYRGEWRRHWIHPLRAAFVVTTYGVLLEWIIVIYVRDRYQPWCAIAVGLATVLLLAYQTVLWYYNRLVITNKRLMITRGVVRRTVAMMPLVRVVDVRYVQSPLGRVLNYGTFRLESASRRNAMRVVPDVPHPNELYLRLVEEMYEPEAVEARLTRTLTDEDPEEPGLDLPPEFESGFESGFEPEFEPGFATAFATDGRSGDPLGTHSAELMALMERLAGSVEALTAAIVRLSAAPDAPDAPAALAALDAPRDDPAAANGSRTVVDVNPGADVPRNG